MHLLNLEAISQERLKHFAERWQIAELRLFGSALRDDFDEASDIDLLVSFQPGAHYTLRDLMTMEEELSVLFGRQVDLGEREAVEEDPNPIRRHHILNHARVIYAQ